MALEFVKGNSEYINLAAATLDFSGDFTICVFIKTTDTVDYGPIFGNWTTAPGLALTRMDDQNFLACSGSAFVNALIGTINIADGNLHFAAMVRNGVTGYLYVDGVLDDSDNIGNPDETENAENAIGQWGLPPVAGRYFDGEMFDLRIYKMALSLAHLDAIEYGKGNDNIVENLVARYLMNEKPDGQTAVAAGSIIDISVNGYHGSPVNTPTYRQAPVKLVRTLVAGIQT